MSNFHKGASNKNFDFARANRKNQTEAEDILWQKLRNRKLGGFKIRRQHPIGDYIVDFYCHEVQLAIEVDGGYHSEPIQMELDERRTLYLAQEGISIIRFTNRKVLETIDQVLLEILDQLNIRLSNLN